MSGDSVIPHKVRRILHREYLRNSSRFVPPERLRRDGNIRRYVSVCDFDTSTRREIERTQTGAFLLTFKCWPPPTKKDMYEPDAVYSSLKGIIYQHI